MTNKEIKKNNSEWNWDKHQIPNIWDFFIVKWIEWKVTAINKPTAWINEVEIGWKIEIIVNWPLWEQIDQEKWYYQKNLWWRPEDYSPEELLDKANKYFEMCEDTVIKRWINWIIKKPKTISWFNLYIKVNKNYLSKKWKDDRFSGTVEYIRTSIENDVEEKALTWVYSPSASQFNLKNNFWWKDKIEVDNNIKKYITTKEENELLDEIL